MEKGKKTVEVTAPNHVRIPHEEALEIELQRAEKEGVLIKSRDLKTDILIIFPKQLHELHINDTIINCRSGNREGCIIRYNPWFDKNSWEIWVFRVNKEGKVAVRGFFIPFPEIDIEYEKRKEILTAIADALLRAYSTPF